MDGQRFDDVARRLGRGGSRSSVVMGAVAGRAGAVGLRSGIARATIICAAEGAECGDNLFCCFENDIALTCITVPGDSFKSCRRICDGPSCPEGQSCQLDGVCLPTDSCLEDGAE